jgi:hypothetical protein
MLHDNVFLVLLCEVVVLLLLVPESPCPVGVGHTMTYVVKVYKSFGAYSSNLGMNVPQMAEPTKRNDAPARSSNAFSAGPIPP